jgi:hypothetical protein
MITVIGTVTAFPGMTGSLTTKTLEKWLTNMAAAPAQPSQKRQAAI